jgi:hypothetical protein
MKKATLAISLLAALTGAALAQEGAVPKGIPHLDHVFVIMMENQWLRRDHQQSQRSLHQQIRPQRPILPPTTLPSPIPA